MKKDKMFQLVNAVLGGVCLIFAFSAWHDVQTADGVGLYLAILSGKNDRRMYDLFADLFGILAVFLLTVLPCMKIKCLNVSSFFRLFTYGAALLPFVSPGNLVHFPEHLASLRWSESMIGQTGVEAFFGGLTDLAALFRVVIPIGILLSALSIYGKPHSEAGRNKAGRYTPFLLLSVIILAAALGFLFENIRQEMYFVCAYIVILVEFRMWESLLKQDKAYEKWSIICFILLDARGIYRMIDIMNNTHI